MPAGRSTWASVRESASLIRSPAPYVVNGWLQYAHPENAKKDAKGYVQVAKVNVKEKDTGVRYRLTNAAEPEWTVLNRIPYQQWMGRSGAIYVVDTQPPHR
jgi:hypothetical protein